MIKFNWLRMLKLSVMEKDLPASRKCWAAGESLERRYWNDLLTHFKNSVALVVIPMHQRMRDKNAIFSPDGFLPKSNVTWSDFIPSWWSEERKGGLSRELSLLKGKSSLSFCLELVAWRPPFPSASGQKSHFPHSQTCHRWQVWGNCLALVPFFKCSCDSQHLSPHMGLQRLASRI